MEFLGEDILPDEQVVCHLLVGTADSRHSVATQADMNLKRIAGWVLHTRAWTWLRKEFSISVLHFYDCDFAEVRTGTILSLSASSTRCFKGP